MAEQVLKSIISSYLSVFQRISHFRYVRKNPADYLATLQSNSFFSGKMGNKVSAETPVTPAAPAVEVDKNPGSMEDLHKKCKDVFPMAFEGYKFLVNKGLSQHFQVSHTLTLSNPAPSGYR